MAQITLNSSGVASNGTLALQSNGTTTAVTIDASQVVGIGVTPSAFGSGSYKALQIGGSLSFMGRAGGSDAYVMSNTYFDQTNYRYTASLAASRYTQSGGEHQWFNAPSGTAGNAITFTQVMTLNASGNLGIGTTSPVGRLDVVGDYARFFENASGAEVYVRGYYGGASVAAIQVVSSSPLAFLTSNQERARIDSSGNLLVGTTSVVAKVTVQGNASANGLQVITPTVDYQTLGLHNTATSGNNLWAVFISDASSLRGSISYNRAGGLTVYNTTSDYRAKTVNGAVQNALSKVALLKPSTGRMNDATEDIDFFVAHELQEVVPSAVTGEKDAVNEDNTPKYQMVDKSALIPLLTAAIQEQQAIIESLKARLDAANL